MNPRASSPLGGPCSALRSSFRDGYSASSLRRDVLAGVVVAIVALPLSMALAIAIGLPPQHGLYTAIVAGGVIAFLGGSRTQVSGPTAAFVAVLLPIVQVHGVAGLLLATGMAGVMLIALGALKFGRYIQLVPYPVIAGFTAGIAITIATGQLPGFLGLSGVVAKAHFHEVCAEIWRCRETVSGWDLGVGALTLALLLLCPRWIPRVPAPLLAIGIATIVAWLLESSGYADVVTILDRFHYTDAEGTAHGGVPPGPPQWLWPWEASGPNGTPFVLDFDRAKSLLAAAVAICVLGAIESLLSAVVADSMTGTRHDPDAELIAQGTGNLLVPFFGGFASTGAIARTATNIKSGAVSPIAAIVHSATLLVAVMTIAPILGWMPMAAMSALLLLVAWRMADVRHVARVLRIAPGPDRAVLVTCMTLTVVFDMVVGVGVGIVLASLLFMRRIARLTGLRPLVPEEVPPGVEPPEGVIVYAIEGPLFFGAAERAMRALQTVGRQGATVVIDLRGVLMIDATGLVNFESALERLTKSRARTILTGLHPDVARTLERAGIRDDGERFFVRRELRDGIDLARSLRTQSSSEGDR